ncbi:MAG: hypothetical protein JSR24_07805 [Proteobacteria bacterium]|nr:hypothetical protein [Pseudomonadota bacterium]
MKKPRLAIVSTFDDLCGIAGYTRCLVRQIELDFEIEVFDLNQAFMRSLDSKMSAAADNMVKEFCTRAKTFDFVNIQLEHGTIGARQKDILRRLGWIVDAAPALSVTFHTVLHTTKFDHRDFTSTVLRLQFADSWSIVTRHRNQNALATGVYRLLCDAQKTKPVNVIVHTYRDAQLMRHTKGFTSVYDHPLTFWNREEAAELRKSTTRATFPMLENLPDNARTIGLFGFISHYKGFDTVVRALRFLPENYHLLLFGSVHPNEIRKFNTIDPYVRHLLEVAAVDMSIADIVAPPKENRSKTSPEAGRATLQLNIDLPQGREREAMAHPNSLARRVHFLGAQTDEDFARAASLCDTVVMPYIEVGQSASGAISIALNMGARVIAARNHAFLQFARYFPDCIEMFDIGNHLELAQRINARPAFPAETRTTGYDSESNRAVYKAANSRAASDAR